ncbi:AfsR/SARP family transcriptional regulator [Micromonospora sp. ATA51]|uniref:AfsR/SARP family transcriptional regulator n=1 Tax=Micromonospora sp. ATA51 TaxID=2806098 RepID=UPI001EE4D9CA|nr:AfsR/SARP family transcriptional regulator [Micromonospora sp. ATA51]
MVAVPVEFRLLGDVEARIDGTLVELGHARQQCVLVALLVEANRTVPIDQLLERVWGDRRPQRARGTLYGYLYRLRRALAGVADVSLVRRSSGYVLTVDPMSVDLYRFRHLIARARSAGDDEAATLLGQALDLWRGDAFETLGTPWLNAVRNALDAERFAAELDRNDLALNRGGHNWLLGQLSARAEERPLDERLTAQLMLALYRCGRQADALDRYELIRQRLASEVGRPRPAAA